MADAALRPRRRRRSSAAGPARGLIVVVVLLSSGLVLYVLARTVVLPWMQITRVIVQADFEVDRDDLLAMAGLDETVYWFNIDAEAMQSRLAAHPMVREAGVERVFPNMLRLELERRRPLVTALVSHAGSTRPIVVDEAGMIFDEGPRVAAHDVPVLSGVGFEGNVVGRRLPERVLPVLESLYGLRVEAPEMYRLISELRIESRGSGEIDVLMHVAGYPVPVRLDARFDRTVCSYALMVLDVLVRRGEADRIAEVDARTGEIVYRIREEADGG